MSIDTFWRYLEIGVLDTNTCMARLLKVYYARASQTVVRDPQVGPAVLPRGSQEIFLQKTLFRS